MTTITFNGPESIRVSLAQLPGMSATRVSSTKPELTAAEFMYLIRVELEHLTNLSDEQIAAYTEDEHAWLAYKADGYSPLEAVEADMEHWS
jgi:hypothetical protein